MSKQKNTNTDSKIHWTSGNEDNNDVSRWRKALGENPQEHRSTKEYQKRYKEWKRACDEAKKKDQPFDRPEPKTLEHLRHEIRKRKDTKYSKMFNDNGKLKEGYDFTGNEEMDADYLRRYYQSSAKELEKLLNEIEAQKNKTDERIKHPGDKEKIIEFWNKEENRKRLKDKYKKDGSVDDYNATDIAKDIKEQLELNCKPANVKYHINNNTTHRL